MTHTEQWELMLSQGRKLWPEAAKAETEAKLGSGIDAWARWVDARITLHIWAYLDALYAGD